MKGKGIRIKGVKKTYNDNLVLSIENVELEAGNIYGLIGNNGVGKTTLLKIIEGTTIPDQGTVEHTSSIEMIYHESGLFQELTVCENMFLQREIIHEFAGVKIMDWKAMKKRTKEILANYELNLDTDLVVKHLGHSVQKLLEIVIALSKEPDTLIIDEPLIMLDLNQVEYLNRLVKAFMDDERMTIFSSHRLDELFQVVDHVITMRDGKIVEVQQADESIMRGLLEFAEKDLHKYPKRPVHLGSNILDVKKLVTDHINGIDFVLRKGEILGIVGLRGAYKSSIGKALFGAIPFEGHIRIDGSEKRIRSTTNAVESGICYIGSMDEGMFIDDSVMENVISANTPRARKLSRQAKRLISKYYLEMLNITNYAEDQLLENMSAGNKQKVLLAKWFFSKSKVFIFNKPTSHIDTSSKVDIYNIIADLAESGAGIVLISNDLEEVAGICDRVLVVERGRIKKQMMRKELSVHGLVEAMQDW